VKDVLVTAWPFTVTENGPDVEPGVTTAAMLVSLQSETETAVPLRETVLVPCIAPKLVPEIVTTLPIFPDVGEIPVILSPGDTVKPNPLLDTPLALTTTLPVVAPVGTGTTIDPLPQVVGLPAVPLNLTVLDPCDAPKFEPVIVTDVPTTPEVGERLVMPGVGSTVNVEPALATPPTVTTTLPVVAPFGTGTTIDVALQLPGIAAVPLNFTVLVPWVAPKFVPVIVTDAATAPDVGERVVIVGVGTTVKLEPLLLTPLALTTTFPVAAPVGTGATMDVAFQEVIAVAGVPLNVNVPVPCGAPKFVPVTVTDVPTVPVAGERLVMLGAGTTVNDELLLATPFTATTTLPVVAPVGTVATIDV
jgi:hypothetical protein